MGLRIATAGMVLSWLSLYTAGLITEQTHAPGDQPVTTARYETVDDPYAVPVTGDPELQLLVVRDYLETQPRPDTIDLWYFARPAAPIDSLLDSVSPGAPESNLKQHQPITQEVQI